MRKLWYIYTMEYYSAIKKNTFAKFPYELRARAGGWFELLQGKRDLI